MTTSTSEANLYTVGPNLVAAALMLSCAFLSDYLQQRALFAIGTITYGLIGWILLGCLDLVHHTKVGYFLTYLTTSGSFIAGIVVPVWLSSNIHTTTGRAVALGLNFGAQNLAGIISSLVFRAQDAPIYRPASITIAVCQFVFIFICLATRQYYARLNRKLDSGEMAFAEGREAKPDYRYAV